ncbi:MAG: threonylcarbamoyl-AMP synthase, partial [Lachnospiraceae bacterium]|nr:threonylcarbamoyl-AMP synthase [Lachnospiraceae bacterium]
MNTEIAVLTEDNIDKKVIKRAGDILRAGGLVAFPTETVYGLGGDALNPESSKKIYAAKGRPSDNPLIVHITNMEALEKIVTEIPEGARILSQRFWPGPLTMIFKKNDTVPRETTGGLDTVAVRMPSNKIAAAMIDAAGGYVAAPSANLSGRPSPTVAKYVIEDMNGRIDMIIDGGDSDVGLESTIVDFTAGEPMILRPGYITKEMLEEALSTDVSVDKAIIDSNSKVAPKAPGMKYRHYAPKGELTIVEGSSEAVTEAVNRYVSEASFEGFKTGVIATEETKSFYRAD